MLSVVTVDLFQVSSVNKHYGLTGEVNRSLITSRVLKIEKGGGIKERFS